MDPTKLTPSTTHGFADMILNAKPSRLNLGVRHVFQVGRVETLRLSCVVIFLFFGKPAVLQSIYGDDAIKLFHPNGDTSPSEKIRYEVTLRSVVRRSPCGKPLTESVFNVAAWILMMKTRIVQCSFLYQQPTPPRPLPSYNFSHGILEPTPSIPPCGEQSYELTYPAKG